MLVAVAAVMVVVLVAYAAWVINQARVSSCPNCARDQEDAPLIPVFFNFLWWCPSCGELQQSRVMRAAVRRAMANQDQDSGFSLGRRRGQETVEEDEVEIVDDESPRRPSF